MSHKATNWLSGIPAKELSSSEFRVLFFLCDCHNPSLGCFPTQAYLIDVCGISNGTLNNALNRAGGQGADRPPPGTRRQDPAAETDPLCPGLRDGRGRQAVSIFWSRNRGKTVSEIWRREGRAAVSEIWSRKTGRAVSSFWRRSRLQFERRPVSNFRGEPSPAHWRGNL